MYEDIVKALRCCTTFDCPPPIARVRASGRAA